MEPQPEGTQGYKVFNDPIHGSVVLHPLLVKIIDTPQFQRLRYLKQLGATYWVYPGATHNRFEHSIGVCYLAGQLVKALKDKQPELEIEDDDVLCVQVAGLCHDLGHGPFSHMFDNMFIPRARPGHEWTHEKASVKMFDHLVDVGLKDAREKDPKLFETLNETNRLLIKELIDGPQNQEGAQSNEWPYQGRTKDKSFLYEVVANKRNGIDVDKWDYFARDCHHLGIQNNFDHRRFIEFARVCEVKDEKKQICIRDKEVRNVYDMFHTRRSLYLKACNHRVCNIIEIMITEAFVKADSHILFEGSNGKMVKLSETIDDMVAYTKVTDHVFYEILHSPRPELAEAQEILERITKRDFYKFVGQTRPQEHMPNTQEQCRTLEAEIAGPEGPNVILRAEDLVVDVVTVDHRIKSSGEKVNPLDKVRVYTRSDLKTGIQIPEAQRHRQLPDSLAEQLIRVYCKKTDDMSMEAARRKFEQWCIVHAYTKWMEISKPSEEEASGTAGEDEQSQEQPGEQPEETGSDETGTSDPEQA